MTASTWARSMRWIAMALAVALLAACGSGPVRRVSEPSVRIQQLTVLANGGWSADLRIENFSSIPMRFDSLDLAFVVAGNAAGALQAQPALSVGPESAEIFVVKLQPAAAAKLAVADALGGGRSVPYTLKGSIAATPDEGRRRTFQIERSSALSPAPGLPGVLR